MQIQYTELPHQQYLSAALVRRYFLDRRTDTADKRMNLKTWQSPRRQPAPTATIHHGGSGLYYYFTFDPQEIPF